MPATPPSPLTRVRLLARLEAAEAAYRASNWTALDRLVCEVSALAEGLEDLDLLARVDALTAMSDPECR